MDNLNWKPAKHPTKKAVKALIKETGLTDLVARLLIQRGVGSLEDAEDFLKGLLSFRSFLILLEVLVLP